MKVVLAPCAKVELLFYFDGPKITEEEVNSANCIGRTFFATFPDCDLETHILRLDYPEPLPDEGITVYLRREPIFLFDNRRSVWTYRETQKMFSQVGGEGQKIRGILGEPSFKERVNCGEVIGTYIDDKLEETDPNKKVETNVAVVCYCKTNSAINAHMIPSRPKQEKIDEIGALLNMNRALLGEVAHTLRAAEISWDEQKVHLFFYYDGEISDEDNASAECIASEFISCYPGYALDVSIIRWDYPKKIPESGRLIYLRREV